MIQSSYIDLNVANTKPVVATFLSMAKKKCSFTNSADGTITLSCNCSLGLFLRTELILLHPNALEFLIQVAINFGIKFPFQYNSCPSLPNVVTIPEPCF